MLGHPITPQKFESVKELLGKEFEELVEDAIQRDLISGISLGILRGKECHFANAGTGLTENSAFEIGSITKSFTCELLQKLIEKGDVKWDDRLDSYLPKKLGPSVSPEPENKPITLGDLATHQSGLPLLPANLKVTNRSNPFGPYSESDLLSYLQKLDSTSSEERFYRYSNVGYAALGFALEQATGKCYADLLKEEILVPLGLDKTQLALYGQDAPPIVQGHAQGGKPVPRWGQAAFAPAGALCSTAFDMLRWCQFLIHRMKARSAEVNIAFGDRTSEDSEYLDGEGWSCHTGMTGGFSTLIGLNINSSSAIVLLGNRRSLGASRAIGENAIRSFNGDPLIPLSGDYGRFRANLLDRLRGNNMSTYLIDMVKTSKFGVFTTGTLRKFLDPN